MLRSNLKRFLFAPGEAAFTPLQPGRPFFQGVEERIRGVHWRPRPSGPARNAISYGAGRVVTGFTDAELRLQKAFRKRYGQHALRIFRACAQTSADIKAMAQRLQKSGLFLSASTVRRWSRGMGIALPRRRHARPRDAKRLKKAYFGQ